VLSTVDMVVQRRDGPRRLRDHDDDDDDVDSHKVGGNKIKCELTMIKRTCKTETVHLIQN